MSEAKIALDRIIKKARVHLYKPIQIAEILHRDRVFKDINLGNLETYRTKSKKWRDEICTNLLGRISTSSSKFQDNLFDENACPPRIISGLGKINREKNGFVEAYIYNQFLIRYSMMNSGLNYVKTKNLNNFKLSEFINLFWHEAGLRRSIDKIYEIIVYALFSSLIECLEVNVEITISQSKSDLYFEFSDFVKDVISLDSLNSKKIISGKINRVGVTNAADRGLDMWANFGLAIQIKHLSLTEELAYNIVESVSADRIVIVCKESEQKIILSLLNQIGWKSKIQSIITEKQLINWYEKALRGKFGLNVGTILLRNLNEQILDEFPSTNSSEIEGFYKNRGYDKINIDEW